MATAFYCDSLSHAQTVMEGLMPAGEGGRGDRTGSDIEGRARLRTEIKQLGVTERCG